MFLQTFGYQEKRTEKDGISMKESSKYVDY